MNTHMESGAFGAKRVSVFICVHLWFKSTSKRAAAASVSFGSVSLRLCGEST